MSNHRAVWVTSVIASLWLIVVATWLLRPPSDELLGTWVIESAEALGQKVPADQAGRMKLEFHSDKVRWHFRQGDGDGTLWRDPKGNPKLIDLSPPDGVEKIAHGIYKIEGETLTISMGAERPKTFEEPSLAKLVFQRE